MQAKATLVRMHVVTEENYLEAAEAIGDILAMYVGMADDYEGFGHSSDAFVRFDLLRFVDATTDGKAYYVDLELLRAGSAMVILCRYYNLWLEEQSLRGGLHNERYEAALNEGRLAAFSDIEAVLREAIARCDILMNDPWFEAVVAPIYGKYVQTFFRHLAGCNRYER